mgnify:CR=1 FL=1
MVRSDDGFSMMEMMVVLAIIAILALLAAPNLTDQIVRDQIKQALPLAEVAKKPVELSWVAAQALPVDNVAAGLPAADKIVNNYIRAVEVQDGALHVTFGNRANAQLKDKVLTLRPAVVDDAPIVPITWVCGYAEPPEKMAVKGDNKTSIPANFLPFNCRARLAKK